MFDLTAYLLLPDWQFVIIINQLVELPFWRIVMSQILGVPDWCIVYPAVVLHSGLWLTLKISLVHGVTVIVQKQKARRQHRLAESQMVGVWPPTLPRRIFQMSGRALKYLTHQMYEGARQMAHGKVVTPVFLLWLAAVPFMQKVGIAIVGISWIRFGWRGAVALFFGTVLQVVPFCFLYTLYGKETAERFIMWAMISLGIIMLFGWLRKNGRRSL
ncbi:MAG: hypothetical protein WCV85_00175 [Patescibacteria group bacterium]